MIHADDDLHDEGAPPTELELMAYYDGELSDDRAREVERWLEHEDAALDDTYGRLADGLDIVGRFVREDGARVASAAPSMADAVMARIASERSPASPLPASPVVLTASPDVTASTPAVVSRLDADVPTLHQLSAAQPRSTRRRVRQLFAAVGVLAAAAACMIVVLAGQADAPIGEEPPVPTMLVATAPVLAAPGPDAAGVAVDTVDFGAKVGTIFLQRGDAASATTVVWIKDDEARP